MSASLCVPIAPWQKPPSQCFEPRVGFGFRFGFGFGFGFGFRFGFGLGDPNLGADSPTRKGGARSTRARETHWHAEAAEAALG